MDREFYRPISRPSPWTFTRKDAFVFGFVAGMLVMDALYVFVAFWLFP